MMQSFELGGWGVFHLSTGGGGSLDPTDVFFDPSERP